MREQLVALAKLAEMDGSAREIETELQRIPAQLDELGASVRMLETMLAQEREQLAQAVALKEAQSAELKERGEGLQRARKKAAQASNIREAEAAEREVDSNRRALREREEELGRIAEAITAKGASLAEREKDFEEAKEVLTSQEDASKTRVIELEAQRDEMLKGREELVARVPKSIVKRYERLRKGLPNAVIIVTDGNCSACRMALPPQLTIELQRATELHQCPHCRRILIHKTVIDE